MNKIENRSNLASDGQTYLNISLVFQGECPEKELLGQSVQIMHVASMLSYSSVVLAKLGDRCNDLRTRGGDTEKVHTQNITTHHTAKT